nr:unnamed protein product [Spirometra erinaceieuropaei]
MDDDRLPKRLFYGDIATGSRRRGGQIRHYKDTLKSSLKRLQINPTNWEELALDRPTWRKKVKTGAAIYEANRIAAAKAKRQARKSQLRPELNAAAQPLPTCPRCQRTFRARIGLVGHLQTNWASRTAPTIVPPPASSSSSPPPTNSDNSSDPPLPSSSSSSSSPTAPTAAAQATVPRTTTDITATSPDSSAEDQDYTCPHCDRTFASHIGPVGHLRIHRTETGEPVREAPTYTHRTRLYCPRTFRHRMGLFGHMRIHESGHDRTPDTPTTSTVHTPTLAPSVRATTTTTTDFSVAGTDTDQLLMPTLSTHIHLTHRPGRSLANPSHRDWRTSAWSTHLYPPSSSQLPTLPSHFQASHGPLWPHAHPRRSAVDDRRSHHTFTHSLPPPPPPPSPHQKSTLTHLTHPTATSHASGKSASRLGPHAASAAQVT